MPTGCKSNEKSKKESNLHQLRYQNTGRLKKREQRNAI